MIASAFDLPSTPAARRDALLALLTGPSLLRLDEPVKLSSGAYSRYFLDAKQALARGRDLALACQCLLDIAEAHAIAFDAVGGLTLGADQFAHGVAMLGDREWFVVRKEPKGRGTNRFVEGTVVADKRIMLVDDVISTGGSSLIAKDRVEAEGARVVMATTLVARSDQPAAAFAEAGIDFYPFATYADLGIPAVGTEEP